MFIFERFWIVFRSLNICGIFPCYKENIDGQDHLKTTNAAWQLIKYLIFMSLTVVAPCILAFVFDVTWEDLVNGAFEANTNKTNKLAAIIILTCYLVEHFLSVLALLRIKKDLCHLQDFINSQLTFALPPENFTFKMASLLFNLPATVSSFVFAIGFAKGLAEYLNYNSLGFTITSIAFIIILHGIIAPIMALLLLHLEILKFINQWLQKLHYMVDYPCESTMKVLREIEKFCSQWKHIQSFISFSFFELYTLAILQIITIVYRSLSFFISQETSQNMTFQAIGYALMGFAMAYSFVFTSLYGQKIGDQVKTLKETLDDQFILDPGKSEEIIKMKKLVLCHLSRWENFDACGFFTLGKPFLTGLLANFITYIIILIQFQLTESGSISNSLNEGIHI